MLWASRQYRNEVEAEALAADEWNEVSRAWRKRDARDSPDTRHTLVRDTTKEMRERNALIGVRNCKEGWSGMLTCARRWAWSCSAAQKHGSMAQYTRDDARPGREGRMGRRVRGERGEGVRCSTLRIISYSHSMRKYVDKVTQHHMAPVETRRSGRLTNHSEDSGWTKPSDHCMACSR